MTLPNFPLDNFVKFMFYFGLFLTSWSIFKMYELNKLKRQDLYEAKKHRISRMIDSTYTEPRLGMLSDTSAVTFKKRLYNIELTALDVERTSKEFNEYIFLAVIGLIITIVSNRTVAQTEENQSKLLELNLKIKELEYENKLKEKNVFRKYIRIK